MSDNLVTLGKEEHQQLLRSDELLSQLIDAGLENWVFYKVVLEELEEKWNRSDKIDYLVRKGVEELSDHVVVIPSAGNVLDADLAESTLRNFIQDILEAYGVEP